MNGEDDLFIVDGTAKHLVILVEERLQCHLEGSFTAVGNIEFRIVIIQCIDETRMGIFVIEKHSKFSLLLLISSQRIGRMIEFDLRSAWLVVWAYKGQ